ncbi:response regulator transcription factor [Algoriphagus sp. NG3]|uniref:response regulator transcription factor n=1 Tax=Algoriphagus sp. NG3 TaxID=3097546 RepID=UPI002A83F996|nr:response regulator transcription factor [Algoriphagus sp. NG3]WPR76788.1 response regulator transcription factor [Algoriphagus sp. NG3]
MEKSIHNILLVEDDLRVATLIQRGLEEQNYLVTMAYDGLSAKKLVYSNSFDLMITDIILPKMDGLELCKEIRQERPDLPIIMLTALGNTNDKVEGFDAGADDYLVKPFEMRELIARIGALLKRARHSTGNPIKILKLADLEMDLNTKIVRRQGVSIHLTPKEFNLLLFLLQNTGRVISRSEIAKNVWDTHFDTGTNYIDVYINYLRKKIDRDFDKKLVHTKSGMGFILMEEE